MRSLALLLLCLFANASVSSPRTCTSGRLPVLPIEGFNSVVNQFASQFQPHHMVNDAIAQIGHNAQIEAKFTYGAVAKDMSKEFVELWVDICHEHYALLDRQRTDGDGRVTFSVEASLLGEVGTYALLIRVVGDGSIAKSKLRVVSTGQKLAVFDIDGTLTAHDSDMSFDVLYDIYHGVYAPPKRAYAAELTHLLRDKFGYEIVYLSGRPHFLNNLTRKWLVDNDFAPGTLKITQTLFQSIPTQGHVGQFKRDTLMNLKKAGLVIPRAYGNVETDAFSYKSVGIAEEKIFLLGKYSGSFGVVGLGTDFESHYRQLANDENAVLD